MSPPVVSVDGTARPYLESELNALKKKQLVGLVLKEIDKWPHKSKTAKAIERLTRDAIIGELILEANNFCTSDPAPHASQTNSFQSVTPQPPNLEFPSDPNSASCIGLGIMSNSQNIAPLQIRKPLVLFVNDARQSGPLYHPQSTEIMVVVHPDTHKPHESRFHARDLMCELQKSNAKVEGHEAVSVSHQHHLLDGYQVTFAKDIVPDDYNSYTFNPDMLRFPGEAGFMFLAINAPKETELVKDQSSPTSTTDSAPAKALNEPTNSQAYRKKKKKNRDQTVVDWIKQNIADRPAVQDAFFNHRNVVLQNAVVVEDWDSIHDFVSDFTQRRFPEPIGAHKISRADICAAVGYSPSWLDDVTVGHRLVHLYGKGGARESEEVINELEAIREPTKGKTGKTSLLAFLKEYNEQHVG